MVIITFNHGMMRPVWGLLHSHYMCEIIIFFCFCILGLTVQSCAKLLQRCQSQCFFFKHFTSTFASCSCRPSLVLAFIFPAFLCGHACLRRLWLHALPLGDLAWNSQASVSRMQPQGVGGQWCEGRNLRGPQALRWRVWCTNQAGEDIMPSLQCVGPYRTRRPLQVLPWLRRGALPQRCADSPAI